MSWLWKRLYRERRRLLIVALLTFLAGAIAFAENTARVYGIPMPLAAGLAFLLGLSPWLMAIALLFPSIRTTAESIAASLPVLALMGVFSNWSDPSGTPSTALILGMVLSYLTATIYGSALIDRYLPRRSFTFRTRATSRLAPETLWPYLDLTPDSDPRHVPEDILGMEWINPGQTFRETSRINDLAQIEGIITLEASDAPLHRCISYVIPSAKPDSPGSAGRREIRLSGRAFGSKLFSARTYDHYTLREILFLWIDDRFGRNDDETIRQAEAKERGLQLA